MAAPGRELIAELGYDVSVLFEVNSATVYAMLLGSRDRAELENLRPVEETAMPASSVS